jgi:hypothetical protein
MYSPGKLFSVQAPAVCHCRGGEGNGSPPPLNMKSPWRQTQYLDNLCRVGTADFLALT